jgi:CIC family chloride channel protein
MTDNYQIILPLMAAVVAATAVSQHILPQSIYTLKLVRRGIRLVHGRLIDIMESVRVSEVMNHEQPTVNPDLAVRALPQLFVQATCTAFPVLDKEGKLFGMVSLEDYQRAISKGADEENLRIKDIATRELVVAYMDEPVRDVLRRMAPGDLSRLPVVSREDPRKLIGVVRRSDVIKAYELGVIRRGAKPSTRFTPRGMEAGEFVIPPDSPVAERKLSEIRIPRDFVVVSIQREGETIIPHGDTELKVGDIISVLAKGLEVDELARFLEPSEEPRSKLRGIF